MSNPPAAGGATASRPEQNYRIEVSQSVILGGGGHAPAELDLSPDRPDYVTADGAEVWIERKLQRRAPRPPRQPGWPGPPEPRHGDHLG